MLLFPWLVTAAWAVHREKEEEAEIKAEVDISLNRQIWMREVSFSLEQAQSSFQTGF